MKRISALLLTIFFVAFGSSLVQALPVVSLDVLSPIIYAGDTFEVNVVVDGVTDFNPLLGADYINSFGFDVVSDPELTYNPPAIVDPAFFDDSGFYPFTDVAGSNFPDPFVFGDDEVFGDNIVLATLSFTTSVAGTYTLGIASDLSDFDEGLDTWLYRQLDMTTGINIDVAQVPEPPTFLLLGSGLVGLGFVRRRFKT